ncbi:hypothetical protein YPPY13_1249, partial [Yersinia pestis PY-13]|jgi:hypothetical protein
MDH